MKRLTRTFVLLASLLSLLCGLVILVVWARSYWAAQYVGRSTPTHWDGVLSMRGILRLEHGTYAADKPGWSYVTYAIKDRSGLWPELTTRDRGGGPLKRLGFGTAAIDYYSDGKMRRYALYLPHWAAALSFAILPTLTFSQAIRCRRRSARGRCPSCGYDLRATPDRCPECGTIPACIGSGSSP